MKLAQTNTSFSSSKVSINAQEKEFCLLGRELHDNINQILTTTRLYIEMAIEEEDIREMLLHKSLENVSKAITEIRKLSKALISPSLGEIGLIEAVDEMIANLNISRRFHIELKAEGIKEAALSDELKLTIYRVIQEQINNIIRHSRATCIEVTLSISDNILTLIIRDNGVGFDSKKKIRGVGLSNIFYRVGVYRGVAEVISSPGKGCSLQIHIPL